VAETAIERNIAAIRERIEKACERAGRKSGDVTLMGVSKFHSIERINEAWGAGLTVFGESRVQEAAGKFGPESGWREGHPSAEIHMIGSLQRNKAKTAVTIFDCVESADRDELVDELGKLCAGRDEPLGVLLELNAGEEAKSGYADEDSLFKGAEKVLSYSGLVPRGLMIMAPLTDDQALLRRVFRSLVRVREKLRSRFPEADWPTLSMGMSGDFEIAVEEGSTLVRIGTAIFGERQP
jgi:pyridoxal phosphate enzyme (YggS family)